MWQEFLKQKMNQPDVTQQYLAQISANIIRVNVKDPKKITLASQFLKFVFGKQKTTTIDEHVAPEDIRDVSKRAWGGIMGMFKKKD